MQHAKPCICGLQGTECQRLRTLFLMAKLMKLVSTSTW